MGEVAGTTQIGVKQAAVLAASYLVDLLGKDEIADVRLEEVERVDGPDAWLITIGYVRREVDKPDPASPLAGLLRGRPQREYKALKIDATTGEVMSMKIRQP